MDEDVKVSTDKQKILADNWRTASSSGRDNRLSLYISNINFFSSKPNVSLSGDSGAFKMSHFDSFSIYLDFCQKVAVSSSR